MVPGVLREYMNKRRQTNPSEKLSSTTWTALVCHSSLGCVFHFV